MIDFLENDKDEIFLNLKEANHGDNLVKNISSKGG